MKISKKTTLTLRILLSIVLLGLLIWMCKPAQTWQDIKTASLPLLVVSLSIFLSSIFLVALRWQILLKINNVKIRLLTLVKYYLIGFFFNNFMPSSIGGDISRIYNVSKHDCPATESFGCVFVERLIGFLAMAALSVGSLGFLAAQFKNSQIVIYITIGLTAIFLFLTIACFNSKLARLITKLLNMIPWQIFSETFTKVYQAIHGYKNHYDKLLLVFFISLLYQVVMGVFVYLTCVATGLEISFWLAFALMQITSMVGIIPITLETAGIREGIFVLVLEPLGYDKSLVVAALLLVRFLSIIGSSFGGVFLISKNYQPEKYRSSVAAD